MCGYFCRVEYTFTFTEDYPGESVVCVYLYSLKQLIARAHYGFLAISAVENTIVCCSQDKDGVSVISKRLTYAIQDISSGRLHTCTCMLPCTVHVHVKFIIDLYRRSSCV